METPDILATILQKKNLPSWNAALLPFTLVARNMAARKEGAYGKAKKGNRSEAVREPLRPAMHS